MKRCWAKVEGNAALRRNLDPPRGTPTFISSHCLGNRRDMWLEFLFHCNCAAGIKRRRDEHSAIILHILRAAVEAVSVWQQRKDVKSRRHKEEPSLGLLKRWGSRVRQSLDPFQYSSNSPAVPHQVISLLVAQQPQATQRHYSRTHHGQYETRVQLERAWLRCRRCRMLRACSTRSSRRPSPADTPTPSANVSQAVGGQKRTNGLLS